ETRDEHAGRDERRSDKQQSQEAADEGSPFRPSEREEHGAENRRRQQHQEVRRERMREALRARGDEWKDEQRRESGTNQERTNQQLTDVDRFRRRHRQRLATLVEKGVQRDDKGGPGENREQRDDEPDFAPSALPQCRRTLRPHPDAVKPPTC